MKTHRDRYNGLSLDEIREAFPEEIKEIVPRAIKELEEEINDYIEKRNIRFNKAINYFTPEYAKQLAEEEMPKEKINNMNKLKALINVTNGFNNGVSEVEIQTAKGLDIRKLHTFNKPRVYGTRFTACCPFHAGGNEKTPSFIINQRNQFKCFSCGEAGSSVDFVMKLHNLKFVDAVKYLNKV